MSFYVYETTVQNEETTKGDKKVKRVLILTKEQADAIEEIKNNGEVSILSALDVHLNGVWRHRTRRCLKSIEQRDFEDVLRGRSSYKLDKPVIENRKQKRG